MLNLSFTVRKFVLGLVLVISVALTSSAKADFTVSFELADFTSRTPEFNDVTTMTFDIQIAGDLIPGTTYDESTINMIDYHIFGVLTESTPSGFGAFNLIRGPITGAEFNSLSPESSLSFATSLTADLSDGLQISDLVGAGAPGPVFTLNARELNQAPGRFHPPILTLDGDGTGRLTNANNLSTFANPGTTNPVDVQIGDEYIVDLTFDQSLTLVVPEPGSLGIVALAMGGFALRRRRRR